MSATRWPSILAETLAQARDAAEKVTVDYELLPAVTDPAKAQTDGAPQIHEVASRNTIYQWHLGDQKAAEAAFKSAKHVTRLDFVNNRLVAERDRAARGDRRIRCRHRRPHAVEHHAEPARGAPGHFRLRRHGARAQAAGDRARCGRRLRLEDLHLSGGGRLPVGVAQDRPAGEMGVRSLGSVPHRRPWPRPRHPCGDGVRRRGQDHGPARQDHRQSRRLHVDVLVVGADLSLRHTAVRPVRYPGDLLRGRCGLYQHRAGRRLSRRRAAGGDIRGRAADGGRRARDGRRSRRSAQEELHQDDSRTRRR